MAIIAIALSSCNQEQVDLATGGQSGLGAMGSDKKPPNSGISVENYQEKSLEKFSQKNVAFFDARIRSINNISYVKELYFANFSEEKLRVQTTYFDGHTYLDNGEGNDELADDGIFTSLQVFNHIQRISYDPSNKIRSVLERPIVHPNFVHHTALVALESTYDLRDNRISPDIFEITCKIVFTGGGCKACDWWGGKHCDYCFTLTECSVTIGI